MIPELGHFALILMLCLAVIQALVPLIGAARNDVALMRSARSLARAQFVLGAISIAALGYAFAYNDFSVRYVAEHSNSALPIVYRIAAVWGGHEGSMLLWVLMLSGWGMALSLFGGHLGMAFQARVLAVMGWVGSGFLSFLIFTSNPFERLLPAAFDGADLNPLLQDPALVIHPPMLYMGYVGFSVAFCFAIAALIEGRVDAAWARWARPWTLAAWASLTLGIGLGSWWAYYELGWGGWWFWDPVENASFMPWLAGTALLHSLAVTDKRGGFKHWTVLLAILTFALSLLGTFLVRSGVLNSVHAFATDPARGMFVLVLLGAVTGISLLLYAWRAPQLSGNTVFAFFSREALLMANNLLLLAALGTVMLGTLYPLALDAFGFGKISVGPPYFNTVFVPLMAPAIFLMAIGPLCRWRKAELPAVIHRLRWALGSGVALALITPMVTGHGSFWISLGLFLAGWLAVSLLGDLYARLLNQNGSWPVRIVRLPRAIYGMTLAHLGIAMFILGATLSGGYSHEIEQRMAPGDLVELGGYTFTFQGVTPVMGENYRAMEGRVLVSRNGQPVTELHPQKRRYLVQDRVMTEASIDAGMLRHLYVALGDEADPESNTGAWSLRLYYKPFVQWIWLGVLAMAAGGMLAATDRRYRVQRAAAKKSVTSNTRLASPLLEQVTSS
ncbi:MAG: heme lyase CcmF/NrfE family subunit [Gammaproteobacteria bacterium]|nr:heme lyase CcmF/NrfE family subunit [Gammaproteobacteria bacterium]